MSEVLALNPSSRLISTVTFPSQHHSHLTVHWLDRCQPPLLTCHSALGSEFACVRACVRVPLFCFVFRMLSFTCRLASWSTSPRSTYHFTFCTRCICTRSALCLCACGCVCVRACACVCACVVVGVWPKSQPLQGARPGSFTVVVTSISLEFVQWCNSATSNVLVHLVLSLDLSSRG